MTTIFCKLAAIEKLKGNRPKKFLNPAGYKNVELYPTQAKKAKKGAVKIDGTSSKKNPVQTSAWLTT